MNISQFKNNVFKQTTLNAVLFFISYSIFSPYLTPFLLEKGFTKSDISFVAATSYFFLIFLSIIFGRISDVIGRKRMINFSVVLLVTAITIYLLMGKNYIVLFTAMALSSIAFEIFSSTTLERIEDNIAETSRGRLSGVYESLRSFGILAGTLVGVYAVMVAKLNMVFVISLILFIAILAFGLIAKSEHHRRIGIKDFNFLAEVKEYWSISSLRGIAIIGMAKNFSFLATTTVFVPLLITQELGANVVYIGIFAATIAFAQLTQFYFGRVCDLVNSARINLISMVLYSVSVLLLFFVTTPLHIIPIGLIMGIALAAWNTSADCFMSKIGEKIHKDGQITGGYSSFAYLGVFLGFITSGFIALYVNTKVVFLFIGIVGIIAVVIARRYMLGTNQPNRSYHN